MYQFYVQVIANNYLKNVVNAPSQMKVHRSFLHGLSEEDFLKGYCELLSVVRQLYTDVVDSPEKFGMPLKENTVPDAKSVEYTQSNAGFVRLPNLLLLMGCEGVLGQDMTLKLSGSDLLAGAKHLKLTKPQMLLEILSDYGFEVLGMPKALKAGDYISVGYPENRYLTVALKSMAEAMMLINGNDLRKSKNHFYMMNYMILENEPPKEPRFTIDFIYRTLEGEGREAAKRLNDFIVEYAKPNIRAGGSMRNEWNCVYNLKRSKKVIMSLNVCQDDLTVKLNLANVGRYIDGIHNRPKELKQMTEGGWGCGGCRSSCAGGFRFEYAGRSYNKCRCGSFNFGNVSNDTVDFCLDMLNKELEYEAQAK